jgi:hypothetical protein
MFFDKKNRDTQRPFSMSAKVMCRGRSFLLQKILTDFGAEVSFENSVKRIEDLFGVTVAKSTTRLDVEKHAQNILELSEKYSVAKNKYEEPVLIGQMDGGMVPIVQKKEVQLQREDQRKNKIFEWKEARLALAHAKGSRSLVYAGTIGSIEEAGTELARAIKKAGGGDNSMIHAVGDGAPWIADQVDRLYGARAVYLLDFFHVSQYLSEASTCCQPEMEKQWFHKQQELLKNSDIQIVLSNLKNHIDQKCQLNDKCLALKCYNYLIKRTHQLDYKAALDAGLPIGSGKIESGHRSVVQKRLKITGAWWTISNAKKMIALRILRANEQWTQYWNDLQCGSLAQVFG